MKRVIFVLLLFTVPMRIWGDTNWYEVELEVADQGAGIRQQAMVKGLRQVLITVSGSRQVVGMIDNTSLNRSASSYVQQFRYRKEEMAITGEPGAQTAPPAEAVGSTDERLLLWMRFDPGGVKQILEQAELPIWGGVRPLTLVWLVVEAPGGRYLVSASDTLGYRRALEDRALRRGLPLSLPFNDLTDQGAISITHIWADFQENITTASQRYAPQALIVGRIFTNKQGQWQAHWTLRSSSIEVSWQLAAPLMSSLLENIVNEVVDTLANHYHEQFLTGQTKLVLHIKGVDSITTVQRVTDFLASVHGVQQVDIKQAMADAIVVNLQIEGGTDLILKAINAGDLIEPLEQQTEATAPPPDDTHKLLAVAEDIPSDAIQAAPSVHKFRLIK